MVSLMAGLKIEGIVKWRGLKSQGPLYQFWGYDLLMRVAELFISPLLKNVVLDF